MIRCLIADDEPIARTRIRILLEVEPDCVVVAECKNGPETQRAITHLTPDLVFLDIQMPGQSGLEVLQALPAAGRPLVVFVTAYDQFALQAFAQHATDYLLKPFDNERFHECLAHARAQLASRAPLPDLGALLQALAHKPPHVAYAERLSVKEGERIAVIPVAEIEWIEADKRNVILHAGARRHILRENIGELEKRLDPARFIRIHRSYIARIDAIKEIQHWFAGSWLLVLASGAKLEVSRNHRDRVAKAINLAI